MQKLSSDNILELALRYFMISRFKMNKVFRKIRILVRCKTCFNGGFNMWLNYKKLVQVHRVGLVTQNDQNSFTPALKV